MDKKRVNISSAEILIFIVLVTIIIFSAVLYRRELQFSEFVTLNFEQLRRENLKQSEAVLDEFLSIEDSLNEFREDSIIADERLSERLGEGIAGLTGLIRQKHSMTDWTIVETGGELNQAFLEFIKSGNRETVSDPESFKENPENDIILEKAYKEGYQLFRDKEFSHARDIFYEALKLYPYDKEIRFYYLSSLFHSEPENVSNFPYLKDQFQIFIYDRLYSEDTLNLLASISLAEDDWERAYEIFSILYEENETNLEYLRTRGVLEFQLEKYDESMRSFRSYLHTHSDDTEINYFYALSLLNSGQYKEALDQFYLVQKKDSSYGNLDKKIYETQTKMENSL